MFALTPRIFRRVIRPISWFDVLRHENGIPYIAFHTPDASGAALNHTDNPKWDDSVRDIVQHHYPQFSEWRKSGSLASWHCKHAAQTCDYWITYRVCLWVEFKLHVDMKLSIRALTTAGICVSWRSVLWVRRCMTPYQLVVVEIVPGFVNSWLWW